jgi:hypothetical protein
MREPRDATEPEGLRQMIDAAVMTLTEPLTGRLEKAVGQAFLDELGGFQAVLRLGGSHLRRLGNVIAVESQKLVNEVLQDLRIDAVIAQSGMNVETISRSLEDVVRSATPALASCGGTSRLMIAVPQRAPLTSLAAFLQHRMDQQADVIAATCGEITVCVEMDQLPVESVALSILQAQPDCAELVERLHCRNDIEWSALTPLC